MSNPLIQELKKSIENFHHEPKVEAIGTVLEGGTSRGGMVAD